MTQQTYPTPPYGRPGPQYGPPPAPYGPPTPPYGPPPGGFGQPPARRKRTGAIVGAVAAAVLVLGGLVVGAVLLLGSTATLDTAEAERQIAQMTEEQAGVAPTDVSCPADIEAEAGATFACSASLEDQPITFTVTQTDDQGNIEVAGDNSFVDVATVEASLTQQLGEVTGVEVVSTCDTDGHTVLVDGVGTPIPCTVTNAEDATDSIDVTATVDEDGAVSYEVL
jgi:hypothetical protein